MQVKPHSTKHVAEHPSRDSVSPSSHPSKPALYPSPQTVLHVDRSQAGLVQLYPASFVQSALQPSSSRVLPSSHSSFDASSPSPQDDVHESGAVGLPPVQLKPHSTMQTEAPDAEYVPAPQFVHSDA